MYITTIQDILAIKTILFLVSIVMLVKNSYLTKHQWYGEKLMQNTKIYFFTSLKSCVIIGHHITKFFVSFSGVLVKLRLIFNRILFYVFQWSIN